jgi:ABC-type branched-subunit amino acid transport system substrate-binding protein
VSAYAYDGLRVIVEAVRRAGLDRQGIRDALAETDYGRGVTGRVRFDEQGNRVTEVKLFDAARR